MSEMTLQGQRGNVTLITAFTMLLMFMIVFLATGLSDTASRASRMQAASDDAAVTAASSYIAVVNDQVLLSEIDWGLQFVQRMAAFLATIGGVIGLVPGLEGLGTLIVEAANLIEQAVEDMDNVFNDVIKDPLDQVLDVAKSILGVINATVAAANNGYLGFMVPAGSLKQGITNATPTQYDLAYVQKRVTHSLRLVYPVKGDGSLDFNNKDTSVDLIGAMQEIAVHKIWGRPQNNLPSQGGKPNPTCPPKTSCSDPRSETRLASTDPNQLDLGRDTFHLWPDTPRCVDPPVTSFLNDNPFTQHNPTELKPTGQQWHRPCNEKQWLRYLMQQNYWNEWKQLQDLYNLLFTVPDPNWDPAQHPGQTHPLIFDPKKAMTFIDHNPSASPSDTTKAVNLITDAETRLQNVAEGNHQVGDYGQIGREGDSPQGCTSNVSYLSRVDACYDNWQSGACPAGDRGHGNLNKFNFICDATRKYSGPNPPGSDIFSGPYAYLFCDQSRTSANPPVAEGCHVYWGGPDISSFDSAKKTLVWTGDPLPQQDAIDYRLSRVQRDEMKPFSDKLNAWAQERFDCSGQPANQPPLPGCPKPGAEANADAEMDFIMTSEIKPDYPTQLAASLSHQTIPDRRFSITASRAQIHKAKSTKDAVHVASICARVFPHDSSKPLDDYPTILDFIPTTAYGWCYALLATFDTLQAIYDGIHSIFDPIVTFLTDTLCISIFGEHICPLGWLGELIKSAVAELLGPPPPDARTFHIELTTVACVPQLQLAADVISGKKNVLDAVAEMEGASGDSGGTCGSGTPGGA